MPRFDPVVTIYGVDECEFNKLVEEWGHRVSLKAMYSFNGEIVHVDSFEEIDRLNDDMDGEGYEKLMDSNRRD